MRISYKLSVEDMREIIAKHFQVDVSDVSIASEETYDGTGPMEYKVCVPVCRINKQI